MEEKEFVHNPRCKTRGIYHHFEGESYLLVDVAIKPNKKNPDKGERYVVYLALYGDLQLYVRPYAEFFEELDPIKYPDAKQKYRFELLDVSDFDYNVFKRQPSHKYQYVGLLFND